MALQIVLVTANNPAEKQIEEEFVKVADKHNISITEQLQLPGDYLRKDNKTIAQIIDDTHERTRSESRRDP